MRGACGGLAEEVGGEYGGARGPERKTVAELTDGDGEGRGNVCIWILKCRFGKVFVLSVLFLNGAPYFLKENHA